MTDVASREELNFQAKLAEKSERYDDMITFVKQLVLQSAELTVDERYSFSTAFKNAIGVRRAAWRMMKAVEDAERSKADLNAAHVELAQKARRKIEAELTTLAQSCCNLIEQQLMPRVDGDEQRVFYLKMTGDYNRYMCEYMDGDARTTALNASRAAYQKAMETMQMSLATTNPIRLGCALNFSVFLYEICQEPSLAILVAKNAFDDAVNDLEKLPEPAFEDASQLMQLLRDNITLWTSDLQKDNDD